MSETNHEFEIQMSELSDIVDQLGAGDVSLSQALTLFQRGVSLSHTLKADLDSANQQLNQIVDDNDEAHPLE